MVPGKVSGIVGEIVQIACGDCHSMALMRDGSLYCWGKNSYGQLGLGHCTNQLTPTLAPPVQHKLVQISCGSNFSLGLTIEGLVYYWGSDFQYHVTISLPLLLSISNIIQIKCGCNHILAISNDGNLFSWGRNSYGQLGVGHSSHLYEPTLVSFDCKRVVQVGCGCYHSLALLSDGSLFSWGEILNGVFGSSSSSVPLPTQIIGINDTIVEIKCGQFHSMVITSNNDLYCWGINHTGQLGNGTKNSSFVPMKIGFFEENFGKEVI
uniref:RCC1-like domain-containing protein n=1 Tax=Arcella intermedia TaxID=1963864 RepID=A0A6B2LDV5_9EUKA